MKLGILFWTTVIMRFIVATALLIVILTFPNLLVIADLRLMIVALATMCVVACGLMMQLREVIGDG